MMRTFAFQAHRVQRIHVYAFENVYKRHTAYFIKTWFFLNIFKFIFYYYFYIIITFLYDITLIYLLLFIFHTGFYNQLLSNYDTNLKILLRLGITTPDFYGNVV